MLTSTAAPRVLLSRDALRRNLRARGDVHGARVDLRHDAYGHGLIEVARVVADAGAGILIDGQADADALRDRGLEVDADGAADIGPLELLGIPDGNGALVAEPVMSVEGSVLSTKRLLAGEAVSYGYTHRATADTRVALVTGGYAQGIPRALGNRVHVELAGMLHPVIGRIAMDVCVVDLQGADADVGTPVTYFGGAGRMRNALGAWSGVTGMSALEMAVVVGAHGRREWC